MSSSCGYCLTETDDDGLICLQCSRKVHVSCLKKLPENGILIGDVFFDFVCMKCRLGKEEKFTRRKLPWLMIIVISLHNLTKQSSGLGLNGHFHFRTHITSFVDKNWEKFFPNEARRKRKNLLGTIAGVLSQHSPEIFVSGTEAVGSIGWWKLRNKWTPSEYDTFIKNRGKRNFVVYSEEEVDDEIEVKKSRIDDSDDSTLDNCCLDTEDDLLKELDHLREELTASCGLDLSPKLHLAEREPSSSECEEDDCAPLSEDEIDSKANESIKTIIEVEDLKKIDVISWSCNKNIKRKNNVKVQTAVPIKQRAIIQKISQPSHLDRYCSSYRHLYNSLLVGSTAYDLFKSPYSGQTLHPFIRRDKKIFPPWLRLMCEVKHAENGKPPERSTIDFCYVKPHHIPAINTLLQTTFWPGIDMTESLTYPDFTIVALYKKLLIGCAFLVPDVCHNEAYISFLAVRPGWQRAGIASFMLYHLTQTSHGKDVLLHVSASNPAICLYQKFGFKTEELVLDFYEKFLPIDSPHSPHALFLRLTR